jgi:hypothetical protein
LLNKEVAAILAWQDKLNASRYAIELLEIQAKKMLTSSDERMEYEELIYSARFSLAAAYTALAIRKAKVGMVGNKLYNKDD